MRIWPFFIIAILTLLGCQCQKFNANQEVSSDVLFSLNNALTEAIIQDGFSPPVASRAYAYTSLVAQLVASEYSDSSKNHVGSLHGFGSVPDFETEGTSMRLVLIRTFNYVAKELVYRDHILDSMAVDLLAYEDRLPDEVRISSEQLAQDISDVILARVFADNYGETRKMPRYSPISGNDKWVPTPPGYTDALEPHWDKIQPFTLDSAGQFFEPMSVNYSTDKESEFYQTIAKQVYDSVRNTNDYYQMLARFWDCNPFLTKQHGHLMYHVRQLTPGGHWMGITQQACTQESLSLEESAALFSQVSVAMADGFIVAWHAKYKTNFIRPETYINRYMDSEWKPILESPHFPEYTSAHSTVSAAAAKVLTAKFGDDYHYIDSTEVPFGLPPRGFDSFFQASDEASLSRVLGGIHFQPAIDMGMKQGREVGANILKKLEN